ncbi:MAG: patatin-like phospholipase family protein [Actinomycetota bacterium]|nr:patatin-like phospholipase family protein [Actinomycetota bacterium]
MDQKNDKRRVAIACQGGGSHAAFTAGVLERLLKEKPDEYEVVAFSGTSGGAICAFLAWYALLEKDNEEEATTKAIDSLHSFWTVDNSAYWKARDPVNSGWDVLANNFLAVSSLLREATEAASGIGLNPEFNPYVWHLSSDYWRDRLKETIEKKIDQSIGERVRSSGRDLKLFIGAVNALTGEFRVFKSHKKKVEGFDFNDSEEDRISVDAVLASAAIPAVFQATRTGKAVYWDDSDSHNQRAHVDEGVYWDGLYSQNPPVRDLTNADPDEIWVIQINPEEIDKEPKTPANISDRRNELSGNVSLNQELYFVRKINELVKRLGEWENGDTKILRKVFRVPEPAENNKEYKTIKVRRIELTIPLDSPSKLDRSPSHIKELIKHGQEQAGHFLGAIPFQITLEKAWEKALQDKDEKNVEDIVSEVMSLFAEKSAIELVPLADSPSGELPNNEGWKTEVPEKIRNVVEWCLRKNLTFEQTRDYWVREDHPAEKVVTYWILATADHFESPIKGRAEVVVQEDRIKQLTFYPLSLKVMDELKEAVESEGLAAGFSTDG